MVVYNKGLHMRCTRSTRHRNRAPQAGFTMAWACHDRQAMIARMEEVEEGKSHLLDIKALPTPHVAHVAERGL